MNFKMRDGRLDARAAVQKVPDAPFGANLIDAIEACSNQRESEH